MLASQIPTKFPIPFGNSAATGTIRPIPQASQTASSPGQASLTDGFPVATGQPLASGGVPPAMQDFNGLFNQITAWSRWQNAGGMVQFDQAFCTSIGGYPQGAVLASTTAGGLWLSIVDNNSTNPDSGSSSGWVYLITAATLPASLTVLQITGGRTQTYSTPGTYTWPVPSPVSSIHVLDCIGGGGGGGGANSTSAAGSAGGGGGNAKDGVYAVTPGEVLTIVVGFGGFPGVGGSSPANGGAGGTTYIARANGTVLCSASGGGGGFQGTNGVQTTSRGVGGAATGGARNYSGAGGGFPILITSTLILGGIGGPAGAAAPQPQLNASNGGLDGFPRGGGANGSSANANGGTGGAGEFSFSY